MSERLLDVAEESANATRCDVRPTTSPATQRPSADIATQIVSEASEAAARAMVGRDTVTVTADIQRAINSTPMRRASDFQPPPAMIAQSVTEANQVARFDATAPLLRRLNIADLKPNGELVADSELVVRYRGNLPVHPIVVNQDGVILDGRKRAASAWAAGHDKIYAVQVASDDGAMHLEWLRWNN